MRLNQHLKNINFSKLFSDSGFFFVRKILRLAILVPGDFLRTIVDIVQNVLCNLDYVNSRFSLQTKDQKLLFKGLVEFKKQRR